ncbi:hypothetical protein CYLTODRAFT_364491 [Cylindrobasidium torrendii FP15055 ss-10]|uniref:CHCH domain-containing protein n=1 Tax=Cylindrobasidium torrendii FP15055 ss-10 TaxID=1314674 RepID=A0A0D7BUB3_9AGAR|nr:hypothetical protein CYLTODRAFT_364491 [Cylindrobasidium torrendii FP15055 ss-10]
MSFPTPEPDESTKVPRDYKEQFKGRLSSKFTDPCEAASKESMKCMDRNNYNRDLCQAYFKAYQECKKTWIEQRKEDRRKGIY